MNLVEGRKPIFIFELANNHQGDFNHGMKIISELIEVCKEFSEFQFAIKFQYRNLDSFIHKDYKNRMDIKNVKRFSETKLTVDEFVELKRHAKEAGFLTICTPFDESSVDRIIDQGFDVIKIASCSMTDWPLLEKIAEKSRRVIASTASATTLEIDNLVQFFSNRSIELTVMHCIAEYPTPNVHLQLNQLDYLLDRYPNIDIGYSTHEFPESTLGVSIAIAKGATVFEKHVGIQTETYSLNAYSANPSEIRKWLEVARETYNTCGEKSGRYNTTEKEKNDLQSLKRGVFAKTPILLNDKIDLSNVYFAFPAQEGQLLAEDFSKYKKYISIKRIEEDNLICVRDVILKDVRSEVANAVEKTLGQLKQSGVALPPKTKCEISHHYGIEKFNEYGVAIIELINREYCKKLLVVLPGQKHPCHFHQKKEESFCVLFGDLFCKLNGKEIQLKAGDSITVERNVEHSFYSQTGCVFEEISTTHYVDDSYYSESVNSERKTTVFITKEMLENS